MTILVTGGTGFLGIAVKYRDDLRGRVSDNRERYAEIASMMGCIKTIWVHSIEDGSVDYRDQMYYGIHLLAGIHKEVDEFEEGYFVVLHSLYDISESSFYRYRLKNKDSILLWTFNKVLEAIKAL